MPQAERSYILGEIASRGPSHLAVENIITEYCKKPTLVYITFWDGDSLAAHRPHPLPQHKFGNVPIRDIDCAVENYKTAFAPLLSDPVTSRLYKSVRDQRVSSSGSSGILSLYPRYEIHNAEAKPIDYYFLENFHRTNDRNQGAISRMIMDPLNPLHDYDGKQSVEWFPHLVVRLREIWDVIKYWNLYVGSEQFWKHTRYMQFFGVLASSRVRLQDYLILIDRKENDSRVMEEYNCFREGDNHRHNKKLFECIKSYDVDGRLPSDMTFADIKDFDRDQCLWAADVEACIKSWATVPGLEPLNAYFVRWKTEEELEAEKKKLYEQAESGLGGSANHEENMLDVLRRRPVRDPGNGAIGGESDDNVEAKMLGKMVD
ncbi:hypothetical protein F4802DRAFT_598245 [Xylaria palmicola]|nr:hypothetical protein F4802DRAFT_598245 [Xylaria palmicola]